MWIEVKLCKLPRDEDDTDAPDPTETFILCRSRDRFQKDEAILRRFEQKIEDRLKSMTARCEKQKRDPMKVEREVGRLLGQNTRAAKLFEVTVESTDEGHARMTWKKLAAVRNLGNSECRLLSAADQCYRLERRRIMEGIYPTYGRRNPPFAFTKATCRSDRSGTRNKTACWPTSWSASWPTCCGRRSANSVPRPVSAVSRGVCPFRTERNPSGGCNSADT